MLYSIQYVYDKDKEGKKFLEGAKVIAFDGKKTYVREIYVGLEFTLEDILYNKINRSALGIKNVDLFKSKFERYQAKGIIYFPDLDKYEFLEENDEVIQWVSTDKVEEFLDNALQPYKELATDSIVKKTMEIRESLVKNLDPSDPLIELSDLSLRRQVSSR